MKGRLPSISRSTLNSTANKLDVGVGGKFMKPQTPVFNIILSSQMERSGIRRSEELLAIIQFC
jgi:hypothetical protein